MNKNIQLERKFPNVQCWMGNHSTNLKRNFDFSNPKILDKEQNLEKRLTLEMIEILNNKNSINKRSDIWILFFRMFIKNF